MSGPSVNAKRYTIVYEDEWLIVVDKASGVLVIPTPKGETNTLTDLLNKELDSRGLEVNCYPCHRLDRETSGLILYAKGKAMQKRMMDAFRERTIAKKYIAFARGTINLTASVSGKKNFAIIKKPIYNRNKRRNEDAVTHYSVIERRSGFTVVEVEPLTGRTNQIRIHFAMINYPLLGERVYAFRRDFSIAFKRVALHAAHLGFTHPVSGERMTFESPVPADMMRLLS